MNMTRAATLTILQATLLICLSLGGCVGDPATGPDSSDGQSDARDADARALDVAVAPDTSPELTPDIVMTGDTNILTDTRDVQDMVIVVPPEPLTPCVNGACWDTGIAPIACRSSSVDEDFSSGNYNVHRYATTVFAEADTTITVVRTGGAWQPRIIVTERDGTVLSDGVTTLQRAGLTITVDANGESGTTASTTIRTDADLSVDVFVTGWAVVASDFNDFLATDADYTIDVNSMCDTPYLDCTVNLVNGSSVAEPACGWLNHIGRNVVPNMSGSRDERLTAAARVAWWSLKEGVLFLQNPIVYSNCNTSSGDMRIGPLEVCEMNRAWQVGLSGVQVPYVATLAELEALSLVLYPGMTSDEVLRATAIEAGLTGADIDAVETSTGYLRQSWLLRNSPIGFVEQEPAVTSECIDQSLGWCYGTGWNATQLYAPDRAGAIQSIADIRAFFDQLAP